MTTTITSATAYVTRARAILATLSGIGTDVTDGADLATTPGYEVFLKGGRHERQGGSKQREVTRVLSIRVYHTRLTDASKEAHIRAARALVQAALETYVDKVFSHVNLSLNDAGIVRTGNIDDSIGIMPYGTADYFGFDIDLTIFYNRG